MARVKDEESRITNEDDFEVQTKEYALSPTLGFEYYLAENISLGGEAYLSFSKSDSTNSTVVKAKSTGTMVTMKYYFK